MLQDGAAALRQARLDWTLGQSPLEPSSMPSFELGWGGAASEGAYAPLVGGEGLGTGTRGWGLGLQGRYVRNGWSVSATALALRDHGHTLGVLQRAALAYQTASGWRMALEQTPVAWGSGLNGGDLFGDASRGFARLSLATPEAAATDSTLTPAGPRLRSSATGGTVKCIGTQVRMVMPSAASRSARGSRSAGAKAPSA